MENRKITYMVYTALMAALIFVATYLIKIPNPATGGYSHMGDCMIFIAVVMLGRRNGSMAAAIGGALSDLLAGVTESSWKARSSEGYSRWQRTPWRKSR